MSLGKNNSNQLFIMKYKHNIDLDKLSDLPVHETNRYKKDRWSYRPDDCHNIGHYSPYTLIDRVCKIYLGKHVNDAFSDYCKRVPKYQQKFFLDHFNGKRWGTYLLDENNNIILNPRFNQKKIYKIYSDDYKIGYKYIGKDKFRRFLWKNKVITEKPYFHDLSEYEPIVISGHIQYFESRKDPRYIKYHAEKQKKYRRALRERRKEDKLRQYNFLTKSEQQRILDKESNDIKIIKHGFDLKTSFRN